MPSFTLRSCPGPTPAINFTLPPMVAKIPVLHPPSQRLEIQLRALTQKQQREHRLIVAMAREAG